MSDAERGALAMLIGLKAIKPHKVDLRYMLCPYCQLLRGAVVRGDPGYVCQCPECGPVPADPADTRTWTLDADWLIRKLRGALGVPSQQGTVSVADGIWRVGSYQRRPLILARSLDLALRQPTAVSRANVRSVNPPWLITPKPLRDVDGDPFGGAVVWLPMEERFALYGGNIQFIEPGTLLETDSDATQAANGPFSIDFRWVHLADWPHGPIPLSDAQAAVFKALWHYKGLPQQSESIMNKAGLDSSKPIDVFKVKAQNKGDPRYEGPLHAYKTLVATDRRAGTYAMSCEDSATA
ncbi:hypothetical protein Q3O93_02665 [Ralstonia pseudosolanacearum]|uniref:hypothetical protein n=1 Tax=Ralstonia pseudosolanacearum TaxID=1310165 RepID=UPI002674EA2D|nr:hypothetical protein [Ralstonia pseudosolanacearum]MDO3530817.1 hypothetical protein [Ralstonia pseudosolanacearum]